MIPQIDWGRPLGLLGLLLPVAVWLFAQRRGAPAAANTGALALWRRVALPEPPGGKRRKRRWTAALWLCLAALTLGALALGAPRRAVAADQQPWHLLLDRSPSMFLDRAGSSRFAFAVDAACAWLDEQAIAPRRRVWAWWRGDSWVVAIGERPPPAWGQVPDGPAPEPPYATRDEGHTLWITDRAPAMAPGQAGLCASGGPAVPGPVSQLGASRLEWDGSRLRSGAAGSAATVGIDAALPEALARLLRLWAKSRALRPVADASRGTSLRVTSSASAAEPVRVVVERDAWRMAVDVCGSGALAFDEHGRRLETWLSTGEEDEPARRSLVSFRPGRIDVALCPGAMDAPAMDATDPAAFAVSWGRLFDACLLPAPGVVSLAERLDAGGAVFSAPAPNPSGVARADESPAALLASLAAALALGAWALTGLRVRQE